MRAITVIGTNVVIDCETVEEAVAYMDRLAATPAPLDVLVAAKAVLPENATGRAVPYDALRRALAATPAPLDDTQKWWAEWFATHTPEQHRELIEGLEAGRKELATPAPLDGRRTAAAATFAEALHRDVPWFVGGSQDAENAMLDAIEAEARATLAPLDVLVAEEAVYAALLYINQRTPRPRAARALMDALRQDGYEVRRVTLAATPAPLDALCGAVLTCALPILHDGDHERADGIRWTWPATPAPLDVTLSDGKASANNAKVRRQTIAATPAPLDVDEDWKALYDNAVEKVNALWFAAQPIIDAAIDIFPEEWIDPESSMAMPVTLRGRDVFALRAALATPAPLDDDGWQERGNPGDDATPAPLDVDVRGDETLRKVGRVFIREWLREDAYREDWNLMDLPSEKDMRAALAATPAPLAPHPGEHHDYRMTCLRCGEPGYLFVGFHSPGETFRWSEAQPKEAE